ncbi:uncharacterized protein METZ01_LOCUS254700 [marine metagenome]|uniref:Uncharacterized protein n=1 Tax=marine metagenome TaxID=408172 RepID=A0A382IQF0_9ZZZZ
MREGHAKKPPCFLLEKRRHGYFGAKSSSRFKECWRYGSSKKGGYFSGALFLVMYLYW